MDETVAVIGAGSWGTALAQHLALKGVKVHLWVYEPELLDILRRERLNTVFLPGVKLSPRIDFHNNLIEAAQDQQIIVMVTPSHIFRTVVSQVAPPKTSDAIVVSATKGIENDTLLTMAGVVSQVLGSETPYAVLSGPSFAQEVAHYQPTAVTVASRQREVARRVQELFASPSFRVYTSTDVMGVELGGALKNVMALGAGILEGLGLGDNPRAAMITRGLAEIARLGAALGAQPLTLSGLAGLGDLVLTCTSRKSRNYQVGVQLGAGRKLADILHNMQMVAEGVRTARSAFHLAQKFAIEMPIVEQVYRIIYEGDCPRQAIQRLMTRELKNELDVMPENHTIPLPQ